MDENLEISLYAKDANNDYNIKNSEIKQTKIHYDGNNVDLTATIFDFKDAKSEIAYTYNQYNVVPEIHNNSAHQKTSKEFWIDLARQAVSQPDKFIQTVKSAAAKPAVK